MRTPAIALVIFDIAGTTVKDQGEVARSFAKALVASGYLIPTEKISPIMGYEKREAIQNLLQEYEPDRSKIVPELINHIHKRFLDEMILYYQTTDELTPLPGVEETFQELRKRGIRIALNTGFSKDITDVILQRLAWAFEKVNYVISSSEVAKGRPSPLMIQKLMQRAEVQDAQQVIKVGDTEVDIREGFQAHCRYSIGVTTGAFTRAALEPYQPSFIIDNISELLPIIDNAG